MSAFISSLLGAFRKASKPIESALKKDCDQCGGSGRIPCPACKGEGKIVTRIEAAGPCPHCSGAGQSREPCPQCFGKGTIPHQLRFSVEKAETVTTGFLWVLPPFTTTVTVHLRNTDDKAGYFAVNVHLNENPTLVKSQKVFLRAGETAPIPLAFQVQSNAVRQATYVIAPELIDSTCPVCGGVKTVMQGCPICNGEGKVTRIEDKSVPCTACDGSKKVACPACSGSGKVLRLL